MGVGIASVLRSTEEWSEAAQEVPREEESDDTSTAGTGRVSTQVDDDGKLAMMAQLMQVQACKRPPTFSAST